jgi:hypothetical protein
VNELHGGCSFEQQIPQKSLERAGNMSVRHSMRGDLLPGTNSTNLLAYYSVVHFCDRRPEGPARQARPEHRQAVRVVGDYQEMVKGYWEAPKETAAMHRPEQ